MLRVTNLNNFTNDPVCYIFMESSLNMQFDGHGLNIMYYMSHMLHITNIKLETILPNTPCVIYFWKAHISLILVKTNSDPKSIIIQSQYLIIMT